MSDGLLMNFAAIENADHMTSRHADEYDRDGWYRAHITELIKVVREQHAENNRLHGEYGPALQRIHELESALKPFAEAYVAHADELYDDVAYAVGWAEFKAAARLLINTSPPSTHTSDSSPESTSAAEES